MHLTDHVPMPGVDVILHISHALCFVAAMETLHNVITEKGEVMRMKIMKVIWMKICQTEHYI